VLLNCISADTKCQAIGQIHVCAEINFSGNIQYHPPPPTCQNQFDWARSVRKDNTLLRHYTALLYAKENHKSLLVIPRSQVCVSRYQFSGYSLKCTESAPWHRLPRKLTVHSVAEEFRGCHGSRFIFVFMILISTGLICWTLHPVHTLMNYT